MLLKKKMVPQVLLHHHWNALSLFLVYDLLNSANMQLTTYSQGPSPEPRQPVYMKHCGPRKNLAQQWPWSL